MFLFASILFCCMGQNNRTPRSGVRRSLGLLTGWTLGKQALARWSRGREAKEIKNRRRDDRRAMAGLKPGYTIHGSLEHYNKIFQTEFISRIRGLLAIQPSVRILDISAGRGDFLKRAKFEFGNRVRTEATGLRRPVLTDGIDKYHIHRFGKTKGYRPVLKPGFDIITCSSGETQTLTSQQLTKRVLPLLSKNGTAFLDLGMLRLAHGKVTLIEQDVVRDIEAAGFRVVKRVYVPAAEAPSETVSLFWIQRKNNH